MQDSLGGSILRGEVGQESHYWNVLPDGSEVDLTLEQFNPPVVIINPDVRSRDYILSYPDTATRYELLRQRVRGFVLDFTKVLDIWEPPEDEDTLSATTDRAYWERKSNPESMSVFDRCHQMLRGAPANVTVGYNKGAIVLSGSHRVFARFFPRKQVHCLIRLPHLSDADGSAAIAQLEENGITAGVIKRGTVSFQLTPADLDEHESTIREVFLLAWRKVGEGGERENFGE